jgi:hypothetical protein
MLYTIIWGAHSLYPHGRSAPDLVVAMNISKIYLHIMRRFNLKISSTITSGKFQFSGFDL